MYNVQCTMYNIQCILYTVQCILPINTNLEEIPLEIHACIADTVDYAELGEVRQLLKNI